MDMESIVYIMKHPNGMVMAGIVWNGANSDDVERFASSVTSPYCLEFAKHKHGDFQVMYLGMLTSKQLGSESLWYYPQSILLIDNFGSLEVVHPKDLAEIVIKQGWGIEELTWTEYKKIALVESDE